ncbi:TonB-dependent receptor [Candidatus Manganitrophus noduliformans]|nr:TonB-dependent receptor [Candidatus Manganitrophus noduliformans]
MQYFSPLRAWVLVVCLALLSAPAFGQEPEENTPETERLAGEAVEMEEVTVTATRAERPVSSIPGSVTVIPRKEIEEQIAISGDLGDLLGNLVPGMAVSPESSFSAGQTLRGRDVLYLIDGVPMNTDLREVGANLQRIDPSAIERIEVIRGASAVYGSGGAGGIVNIITRQGKEGRPQLRTELRTRFSVVHPDESFSKRIEQSVTGGAGRFNYLLGGSFEDADSRFDANGDRIPRDFLFSDSDYADLFGKLGYKLTDSQRLQFSANYYRAKQERAFAAVGGLVGHEAAEAVEVPPGIFDVADAGAPANPLLREQEVYTLDYFNDRLFGSAVNVQLFFSEFFNRGPFIGFFGGQNLTEQERKAARLNIDTPFTVPLKGTLTWGADLGNQKYHERFTATGSFTPLMDQDNIAGFAQLEVPLAQRVLLRGGLRYELFRLNIPDFTTHPTSGGNAVEGGTLDYDTTTFNLGGVFFVTDTVELFAGFSQGFSITEVGRSLIRTTLPSVEAAKPEPKEVDNYEIGARGAWSKVKASLSTFYSTSDLGTTFVLVNEVLTVQRAPEKVYGVEVILDTQPFAQWGFGGTFSWQKGKREIDGDWTPLPGNRIAPPKATAYVEYALLPRWRNRLQMLYSGNRDEFPGSTAFAEGKVDDFLLFDLLSEIKVWRGTLKVGIENLLNAFYVPPPNQAANFDDSFTAGQGMTASLGYEIFW